MRCSARLWPLLTTLSVLAVGSGTASADPPGTQVLNPGPANAPTVRLLGGSGAGLLYELSNPGQSGLPTSWFKPTGGTARQLDPPGSALAGVTLYTRLSGRSTISYRKPPSAAPRQCTVPENDAVAYTQRGWVQHSYGTDDYLLVLAGTEGCVSVPKASIPNGRLLAADERGFAVEVTTTPGNGGVHELRYVPYDDPAHPVLADTGEWVYNFVSMSNGVIAWARRHEEWESPGSEIHRWKAIGGADPVVVVGYDVDSTAVNDAATGFAGCLWLDGTPRTCVAGSIPAGGGPVSTITSATSVTDDDTSLFVARFGAGTGIERGISLAGGLTRVADIPLLPPVTGAVALGASRVAYIDSDGSGGPDAAPQEGVHWRYAAKSGSGIRLLAPIRGGDGVTAMSVDGRRQLIGRAGVPGTGSLTLRTEGEPDTTVFRDIPGQAIYAGGRPDLSGTRALWIRSDFSGDTCDPPGCPQYGNRSAMLYDVRTRTNVRLGEAETTKWALWGSYVVWATRDGSIYRRELSSNKTVMVKPKGYGVVGLGVWGSYVGWSECVDACYKGNVAYRNMATGAPAVRVAAPGPVPLLVRVTGGHVVYAYGDRPGAGAPHLRELRLGTTVTAPIADAPWATDGSAFDAYDEVLAWISRDDQQARIAPNSAFVDPPKYLGNALVSGSFTPNGDGVADVWAPEFPVSKALPVCQVVVRSKVTGTVLRRLPCAASTGSARATWDGRIASGRLVPKGSYSWTLTGSDSDGALRLWNGATTALSGSVAVD